MIFCLSIMESTKGTMEQLNIGSVLKNKRESLGLSLEDVYIHLKINLHNLQALEDNNYTLLPEPPFTRVFIKSYADFLGLDGPALARQYEENLNCKPSGIELEKNDYLHFGLKPSSVIISLILFFLVIILFVIWCRKTQSNSSIARNDSTHISATLPDFDYQTHQRDSIRNDSIITSDSLRANDSTAIKDSIPLPNPTPAATSAQDSSRIINSHCLTIVCTDTVWVKAIVDSSITTERLFLKTNSPTARYNYRFNRSVALHIGNAAGVYMIIDNRDTLNDLGPHGKSLHFYIDSLYLQNLRKK